MAQIISDFMFRVLFSMLARLSWGFIRYLAAENEDGEVDSNGEVKLLFFITSAILLQA